MVFAVAQRAAKKEVINFPIQIVSPAGPIVDALQDFVGRIVVNGVEAGPEQLAHDARIVFATGTFRRVIVVGLRG
jgi:hypothetical protein